MDMMSFLKSTLTEMQHNQKIMLDKLKKLDMKMDSLNDRFSLIVDDIFYLKNIVQDDLFYVDPINKRVH